ncbi:hypothetical protein [Peribacillus huizhouensis]|uniref:Uncharacterized protein n=1 Tax=Peribacillus huizhouensis TaxID=1501239 RepID=A0ABR6CTG8_9BACI|nr:hypothetical protein [Peribacillus huizhouensis]MBA9028313.1 hypothetical protein [Peribacillus huizhouensis]
MPNTRHLNLSEEDQHRLLEWWQTMESAKPVVHRLISLVSELRLNPESSHADGMILFYRAISEISYGYAGVRGGVRRAFTKEYGDALKINMVMCISFIPKFSGDAKVLLERIAKQVTGSSALQLIQRIREMLKENDIILNRLEKKAHTFIGKDTFQDIQVKMQKDMIME